MERLDYPELLETIVKQYSDIFVGEGTEVQIIADRPNGHYVVMFVGWRGHSQVYGSLIHLDLKDDRIWVQRDGTQEGIVPQLLEAGVPKSDIVLGYRSPSVRKFLGFGIEAEQPDRSQSLIVNS